ncbi:MAG: lamin tail domain-containing protein [Chitinispirillaceae bacterium]|nr:lamin tail domain-containing protein [Chitinispirillaceae bacterium]
MLPCKKCSSFLISFVIFLSIKHSVAEVAPVTFNVDHGFFESSFTVVLSTETKGATIKYTLDCSNPLTSPSAYSTQSPGSVVIDSRSTVGRAETPAVVLRAVAVNPPDVSGPILTRTFIFTKHVSSQTNPGGGWPKPNPDPSLTTTTSSSSSMVMPGFTRGQVYDYDMDSSVIHDPRYKDLIEEALLAIPSISLVSDLDSLFTDSLGIFENALNSGRDWERAGSIELLPHNGSDGFAVPCGIRIRGGWSRHEDCPKHSFRLYFRSEYGLAKLKFPLFGDEGASSFDKVSLRTAQNYSWSYYGKEGAHNTMVKDVYCRDSQREMGHYYTRSRYYHLYLDGMYWGIYQTQEQADKRYAETYMGGDHLDYDVLNTVNDYTRGSDLDKTVEVADGTIDAAARLWTKTLSGFSNNSDYYMIQGLEADGKTRNHSYERLLDIDNLIDYLLITFYTGNFDSPTYAFSEPQRTNNLQAIYNRINPDGFKWLSYDGEHTMVDFKINQRDTLVKAVDVDRTGPYTLSDEIRFFNPQRIHQELCANSDYRMRFADHVYKHFFNGGVFCPEPSIARYKARAKEIETAIIAESARWGDSKRDTARTKDDDWIPELERIYNNYMPLRTDIVIDQFKKGNLYPPIEPPVFTSGEIISTTEIDGSNEFKMTLSNPNTTGDLLYTTDGNDPRLPGGEKFLKAIQGESSTVLSINTSTIVKARIVDGNQWSALKELFIAFPQDFGNLKITEIHYKPVSDDNGENAGDYEFFELKNTGAIPLNLTGVSFSDGFTFTFEQGTTINAGDFFVLASNAQKFSQRYGFKPDREYTGQLSNEGERIALVDKSGNLIMSITYEYKEPWPADPVKKGNSLIPTDAGKKQDQNNAANWTFSNEVHGSPGRDDPKSIGASVHHRQHSNLVTTVCHVGRFRFVIPFSSEYQVSIINLQGKSVAQFPERGRAVYDWRPDGKGVFIVLFRDLSGKQLAKKVHVIH